MARAAGLRLFPEGKMGPTTGLFPQIHQKEEGRRT